jgi:hypothetical protein
MILSRNVPCGSAERYAVMKGSSVAFVGVLLKLMLVE